MKYYFSSKTPKLVWEAACVLLPVVCCRRRPQKSKFQDFYHFRRKKDFANSRLFSANKSMCTTQRDVARHAHANGLEVRVCGHFTGAPAAPDIRAQRSETTASGELWLVLGGSLLLHSCRLSNTFIKKSRSIFGIFAEKNPTFFRKIIFANCSSKIFHLEKKFWDFFLNIYVDAKLAPLSI